jgi:endonuclease YncB( thermonuclease family)
MDMGRHFRSIALAVAALLAACSGAPATTVSAPTAPTATPQATGKATPTPGRSEASATPTPELGIAPIGLTEIAVVLSITDGDTIRVDRGVGSERLRYIGMNTPEVGDPGADEATAVNARLVEGMGVFLERDVSETDQFGRLLRYVWIDRGAGWTFVNLELVRLGFAEAATYPPDVRYVDLFVAAEREARAAGVGLWAPAPTAPTTPSPEPTSTAEGTPGAANCHPSYDPCLPIVADLDCLDVPAMGLAPIHVIGPDDYRLDGDHDGIGCE